MKIATLTFAVLGFLFLAVGVVLIVCSLAIPGLACLAGWLTCIAVIARIDPDARASRQRTYRKAQRRLRHGDATAIPKCAHCRVIVFPDGHTERVPCHWHADIQSVALEREATR